MSSRLGLLLTLLLVPGCADFHRGDASPDAGTPSSGDGGGGSDGGGDAPSFATDAHPLLLSGCQSCHRAGGAAGNTGFVLTGDADADFQVSNALTDTAAPAGSRLLRKAAGAGHGGGAIYADGTPEYQKLLAWIAGGALP
ncbi:hypothetical protein LXT21_33765 [Myxococcus sp. K38C18041901]|uniref:hypothetical protein n=1 Tax=Myxococcus guangdongensis TaxID=2906760 RepID=UPI0020A774CE|nr:hypothetical protein [Myxococcus guangdongensis]MCP3063754.1 hypothetical protein [Myxococcus guangdongensis]